MPADGDLRDRRIAIVLENEHDFPGCIATFERPRYEIVATGEIHDGTAGVNAFLLENRAAFPDFRFEPSRVTPADDVVLVEGVFTGTQTGNWRGLPATGRSVDFRMAVVFEFEGEAPVCERVYFDLSTPLRQLGVSRNPLSLGGRLMTALNHPRHHHASALRLGPPGPGAKTHHPVVAGGLLRSAPAGEQADTNAGRGTLRHAGRCAVCTRS